MESESFSQVWNRLKHIEGGIALVVLVGALVGYFDLYDPDVPVQRSALQSPIVFVGHSGEQDTYYQPEWELMLMDVRTGTVTQLTFDTAIDQMPRWSPSGTHLMYLSTRTPSFFPPYPKNGETANLFVYDLEAGRTQRVDLSWAREAAVDTSWAPDMWTPAWVGSNDASAFSGLPSLSCLGWSSRDSTHVAVSLRYPYTTREHEEAVVLADLERQTVRFLSELNGMCSNVEWSPDGRYLALHGEGDSFTLINLETGENRTVRGDHTLMGARLQYVPADWGTDSSTLLVQGRTGEPGVDSTAAFRYHVADDRWSTVAQFPFDASSVVYAPVTPPPKHRDLIISRAEGNSEYDLWRYRRPSGTVERLTDTNFPKYSLTPLHQE